MTEDKDVFIGVVTHKMFDKSVVPDDGYHVIKVGRSLSDEEAQIAGYELDKFGENISNENPYYCELTAQYWMWKNLPSNYKYIGLVHYRRYFFDYSAGSKNFSDDILSSERTREILRAHKVILSFLSVKARGGSMLYKNKTLDKQDPNWVIIDNIIKTYYPEMYSHFLKWMYGRFTAWGNMLITSRQIFDEYSKWLFDVLHRYDEELKKVGCERTPRVDGYLAEHLLVIWMYYNFTKKDIYWAEVRNTETDGFVDYKASILGYFIKKLRSNRTTLYLLRMLRMGWLLITRK